MVRNENIFLPLWLEHYGRELGRENLYIVDHASTDGSTDAPGLNITRLPDTELDERQRALFISRFHASLLVYYDCVIYTDADEFLGADPLRWEGLRYLVERTPRPVICGIRLDVLHDRAREPDLDVGRPILAQRRWARFNPMFCKPLISRRPLLWQAGFHFAERVTNSVHVDLYLFHLKSADWKIAHATRQVRSEVTLSARDRNLGQSTHFGLNQEDHDSRFFGTDASTFTTLSPSDFRYSADLAAFIADMRKALGSSGSTDEIPTRFGTTILGLTRADRRPATGA